MCWWEAHLHHAVDPDMADCVVVDVLAAPGMDDWLLLNDGLSVNGLHRLRVRASVHTVVRYVHQDGARAATDSGQSSVTRDTWLELEKGPSEGS